MRQAMGWAGLWLVAGLLAAPRSAQAQTQGGGAGGSAGGAASIESGDIDTGGSASGGTSAPAAGTPAYTPSEPGFQEAAGGPSGTRLGLQARLDGLNTLDLGAPIELGIGPSVPIVTPGVRFLDGKLFLGFGLGFEGGRNDTNSNGADRGQSGFSLSPLVSYDVLSDAVAALHLVGWFNIATLSKEETCNNNGVCTNNGNSDADGLGLNIGAGVRGKLSEGLALGGEFGWGFMSGSVGAESYFNHGVFGTLLLEASVGL